MILLCFWRAKTLFSLVGTPKTTALVAFAAALVFFSVPTRENNVFLLSFHCTEILHNTLHARCLV
jgi:hypothetical protein